MRQDVMQFQWDSDGSDQSCNFLEDGENMRDEIVECQVRGFQHFSAAIDRPVSQNLAAWSVQFVQKIYEMMTSFDAVDRQVLEGGEVASLSQQLDLIDQLVLEEIGVDFDGKSRDL